MEKALGMRDIIPGRCWRFCSGSALEEIFVDICGYLLNELNKMDEFTDKDPC